MISYSKGLELERRARAGMQDRNQVPMEMQVALGHDGTAVLTGHRWNPLGIEVQKSDPR